MSRTDKDNPFWVDTWWEAWHACRGGKPCSLAAEPDGKFHADDGARTCWNRCHWFPLWPTERHYAPTPPRWYRRHRWYAGDRFRARTACAAAAAEYRATGAADVEPPTVQHRHNATWDWT